MNDEASHGTSALRDKIAEAIYGSAVNTARATACAYDFQIERVKRVILTARSEPDRSAAILMFALAEDLMLHCFRTNFNPDVRGGWDAVTDGNGLLATASDRIMLLDLLCWVRLSTVSDLRLLKSIRNRFAHHADIDSFGDKKVLGWISSLTPHENVATKLWPDAERADWRKLNPRELYLVRASSAVALLVGDLAVGPAARQQRVSPLHVEGNEFDSMPEPLKEIRRIMGDCILAVLPPR